MSDYISTEPREATLLVSFQPPFSVWVNLEGLLYMEANRGHNNCILSEIGRKTWRCTHSHKYNKIVSSETVTCFDVIVIPWFVHLYEEISHNL